MMNYHNPQKIFVIISLFFILVLMRLPSEAAELQGTVIAIQGDEVTVKIDSSRILQPTVGDNLNIMERPNEDGNALGIPGDWVITEVTAGIVKAKGRNLVTGLRPQVNMQAFIQTSPGPAYAEDASKASSKKKSFSTAKGKVIMTRGKNVTIQLEKGQPQAALGDVIELSFTAGGVVIPVGTWRVSAVNRDGIVEAKPLAPEGGASIDMDAVIQVTKSKTKSIKKKKKETPEKVFLTGLNYLRGKGVKKNEKKAFRFIKEAADLNHIKAQAHLGLLYERGIGHKRDIGQAVFYYTKGCDRDNGWACSNLARKYDRGIGVEKDKKKAAELFKKGCKFEHPDGCAGYGWLLYHGQQFQKDEKKGIKLLQRGCKEGVGWSCKELQKISSKK